MVEGASGFGTPAALGAPLLISVGHPKLEAVVMLLIFNTFATVCGAVGTPIWFGFGNVATEEEWTEIAFKGVICTSIGAFFLIPFTLIILIPWVVVRKNIIFVMLSLCTVCLPAVGIAYVSYEFPSLIGGMVGCGLTAVLISFRIGLAPLDPSDMPDRDPNEIGTVSERSLVASYLESIKDTEGETAAKMAEGVPAEKPQDGDADKADEEHHIDPNLSNTQDSEIRPDTAPVHSVEDFVDNALGPRKPFGGAYIMELCGRTSPIWGCVIILIITRLPQIGLKYVLTYQEPYFQIDFNTYGVFRLSASLVFQLRNILTYPNLNWRYELLYVPFLIPFVLMSEITMIMYRKDMGATRQRDIFAMVFGRLVNPFIALLGALALVQLLIRVETEAPAYVIGVTLADWFKQGFVVICPLLGALGSFFSGSTTVSNLTFGSIQVIAAEAIGISKTSMLALQAVGASAGNGICLNNIIAACTITGLVIGEGTILAKTYKLVFSLTTIATIVMLAFFMRFK
jgi:L-lactate permease